MYDPIFSKSFNRYDRKRFGFCAIILCFIIAIFTICSSFKPHLQYPLLPTGNAFHLHLSINAGEDMLMMTHESGSSTDPTNDTLVLNGTSVTSRENREVELHLPINANKDKFMMTHVRGSSTNGTLVHNCTSVTSRQSYQSRDVEVCRVLESNADYCEIKGDIRVNTNSSSVYVMTSCSAITSNVTSWTVQPYPRRGIGYVKNWTITLTPYNDENAPKCSKSHSTLPAILFSLGGYSGNHFHDFADLILPLYSTVFHFKRDVQFLVTDYKPWWPSKFLRLLQKLTKHDIVDIDRHNQVNCYSNIIIGLRFHKELIVDPSSSDVSITQFRQLLRQTYSLERKQAIRWRKGEKTKPRLMIISRKRTRILTNVDEVYRAARKLGYEVVIAEGQSSSNLTEFAQLVNSVDVMMGIHGAGLTNMVFLPDNAVLIQIVPLGAIDGFARLDFGNPAPGMNIRYLEHKIGMKESSIVQQYPMDHPVITDPLSILRKGWDQMRAIYLDNQNVTIDVQRFRGTLSKALKLLRR